MAAPFFTGAYALLRSVMPNKSMAELRARLIGGSRTHASLNGRVNAGGSVDLSIAASSDTRAFAPVIDEIAQSGNAVTVKGWFFGSAPRLTLGGQSIEAYTLTGSDGECTLVFPLPKGMSGVQTLTLEKSNGRSYRMRYDYQDDGNMTMIGPLPEVPNRNAILCDLFSYGGSLFYLVSTTEGFSVCSYENGAYSNFISLESANDRAARDDFSTFVKDNILYVYDFSHIHRFDMSARVWLEDIPSPFQLNPDESFNTGAIADFKGRLMLVGGQSGGTDYYQIRVYENGAWTVGESLYIDGFWPQAARAAAAGGKLVVFAHNSSLGADALLVFDGSEWSVRECPYAGLSSLSFASRGNEIFCFGDRDDNNGILAYNVQSDSWRRLPYRSAGLAASARGALVGKRLYTLSALQDSNVYVLQYVDLGSNGSGSDDSPSALQPQYDLRTLPKSKPDALLPPATGEASALPFVMLLFSLCLLKKGIKKRPRFPQPSHGSIITRLPR